MQSEGSTDNGGATGRVPWLSDSEQVVWRRWIALRTDLQGHMNRSLQDHADLSIADYEVLVMLSEDPGSMRVSQLARHMGWERSRLSHHVSRMEKRGLVRRAATAEDGRGADVSLTAEGREVLESAAPVHVRDVRSIFFDGMTPEELAVFDRVTARMLARLRPDDPLARPVTGTDLP
ncbi:MarR family winged helix-turn-helix transcriptional regulator [Kytococcus sp. Marseille-QA3725]